MVDEYQQHLEKGNKTIEILKEIERGLIMERIKGT